MLNTYLKSKIMYLTITQTHESYEGSLGIPAALMEAAGILAYEKVLVANRRTGERWETYAVPDAEGECSALGIATHYAQKGDELLVMAWTIDTAPVTPQIIHPVHNR